MAEFDLQQGIAQQQTITIRQLQSLQLLYVPIFELEQTINQSVELNPILEYEEFAGDNLNTEIMDESIASDIADNILDDEENTFENYYDTYIDDGADNYYDSDAKKQRDNFFDSIVEQESMQQQLLDEIHYLNLSLEEFRIAEIIIGNIDDSGILSTTIADIAMVSNSTLEEVEKTLKIVQSISIPGVGARDLAECLKLQLIAKHKEDEKLFYLIDNHLDDIGKNRLIQIAKAMSISISELNYLIEEIRQLTPHPGTALSNKKDNFIIPEGEIRFDEKSQEYYLIINDYYIPKIRVSNNYDGFLKNKNLPAEDRQYIRQKLNDAHTLQNSLFMREHTIERIARAIMIAQHDFWSEGANALKPMTMSELAVQLELHEATISRACANKYLLTPQGLLEFRYFFTHGVKNDVGESISNMAIKEKIRQIIGQENPKKPLSDDKLSTMLKVDGISISRRTVAKYRDALEIPPTHLRKAHV